MCRLALLACCLVWLLALTHGRTLRQAVPPCPYASDNLGCIRAGYAVPASLAAQMQARLPPLTVGGFPNGDRRLLDMLPLPEMVQLLHTRLPYAASQCTLPALPAVTVLSHAANPASPHHASFAACLLAPMLEDRSYVFGTTTLHTARDLSSLPSMRRFKSAFSPQVSVCSALNPCSNNLFLGFQGMERPVRLMLPSLRAELRLQSLMYSHFGTGVPPAWRTAGGGAAAPTFWQLDRPDVAAALGRPAPLAALTSVSGRLFLGGSLRGGSTVSLDGATIDLGQQASAWLLWRDEAHPAVSLRLATAPDLSLWGALALPLRSLPALRDVDLLVRTHTSELWLTTAQQQTVPVRNLAVAVPTLGAALARLLADPSSTEGVLTALDAYYTPQRGLSLRLHFSPGYYSLTAEGTAAAAGQEALMVTEGFGLVLHANRDTSSFSKMTLKMGGAAFPLSASAA